MNRNLCVCLEFLTPAHRGQIEAAAAAAGFTAHFFTPEQEAEAAACLQTCEVLYAHSPELLRAAPASLGWYCCAYAGVDPYCREPGLFANPDCLLTNSAGAYGVTISEHLLMVTLMLLRRMPEYEGIMARGEWENDLPVRSLQGSEITILGTGDLGTTFARKARALGAGRIVGVSRSGKPRPGTEGVYDELHSFRELDALLPRTELLVMALPGTPETTGLLSAERIALLPSTAYLVNVGRGTALDQAALADALNSGRLAGAALDVMVPEPLPAGDPLRRARNLILTPHVAGNMTLGHTCDVNVRMFCEDLARYAAGQPLRHLVDRTRGY